MFAEAFLDNLPTEQFPYVLQESYNKYLDYNTSNQTFVMD